MKNIITIQHTQSIKSTNGMVGSWTDWDLTELGINEARRIGEKLSEELKNKSFIMYSSDLLRAKRTAEIIGSYFQITPVLSKSLREFNFGEAVGKSREWAKQNAKTKLYPHWTNIDEKPFEGSESMREVWGRLSVFFNELMKSNDDNIIIVSHSGTLSLFYALWLGLNVEMINKCSLFSDSGGVSYMNEDEAGRRIISRLNDLSYKNI